MDYIKCVPTYGSLKSSFLGFHCATVSRPGCGGNGAEEGENVGKLKGVCPDKDVRNCNGKRESADFGSCGVDGVKRARPSIGKVGDERIGPNRWGVESGILNGMKRSVDFADVGKCRVGGAEGGMKQSQCRQSVDGKGIDGVKQSHFKKDFESRMGGQRIREKEKDRAIDGMSRQSHLKKYFESRMGDHRIREKVKATAIDGMSRQSHFKKNFEARMGERRVREKAKARAIDGIRQSPHSKKSFEARMGDQRIRENVKARAIDGGMSRQFQFGGRTQRKGYNKMGSGASGRVLERAAFIRATSSLNEETGPNEPVGNSGRSIGMKMSSGNQRRAETNRQVEGRASRGAGVGLHPRAPKLCFMKPKCKFAIKSSARIVDEQDRTQGNGASYCLPRNSGILREGDSNYPESSRGREQAMGLKSEANCSSMQGASDREKVKKVLRLFQLCCKCLLEEAKADHMIKHKRVDARAYEILRQRNCFVNTDEPILGNVAGVEVGDEFQYRLELCVVGLHRPTVNGIDYIRGRRNLATSIVSSGVYDDIIFDLDTIIYTGEGGRPKAEISLGDDQQLTNGNLALKNSMVAGTSVRVIRGIRKPLREKTKKTRPSVVIVYIYYGLYVVEKCWSEIGVNGFLEFKFQLRRMPGQPKLTVAEAINCRKWKP